MAELSTLAELERFLTEHGSRTYLADLQRISSSEIARAENVAPFESGQIAITSLRPLLIQIDDARVESGHLAVVVRFLNLLLCCDSTSVVVGHNDRAETMPVSRITVSEPPAWIFVFPSDEFGVGQSDPRAMHRIVARLRAPDGCPWDREQTHRTIAQFLVDEVYEVVDAAERDDMANLAEELGDLFLLILMQAQIAHEHDDFAIEDVYRGVARKIVGRHPHVFGDEVARNAAEVIDVWQSAKARERTAGTSKDTKAEDGQPHSMPALLRATRVLRKYPIRDDLETPRLLREIAAIVDAGDDPEMVLREQLRLHVRNVSQGGG